MTDKCVQDAAQDIQVEAVDPEIILSTLKREDPKRSLRIFITFVAVAMALFQLYTANFGVFDSIRQRSLHIAFVLILTFLIYEPTKKLKEKKRQTLLRLDWVLIGLVIISYGYTIVNSMAISSRLSYVTPLSSVQLWIGIIGMILLIEAARRTVGNSLPIICLFFLTYLTVGQYLPGLLRHRGYGVMWAVDHLFFTTEGVFGIPASVSATYIYMFVLFGTFLEKSGGGQYFIDLAVAGMGRFRGGPAKTAILASGLMGMISGSAVANTVTTGAFTIPLMKKMGYKPHFAGAVEAVASSGGQFTPPIMGATAFIIAEFTGISYIQVAAAAIIPAILYYVSIFWMVHFEAVKLDLKGMKHSCSAWDVFKRGFYYLVPIAIIIYMLVLGWSPLKAGVYAIFSIIIITLFSKVNRMNVSSLFNALEAGSKGMIEVAIACGAAGLIIGVVSLTGIGLRFSALVVRAAGGNLLVALVLTMITSLILGMGLPTVAAYIIQAALTAPALVSMGVPVIAAHLFVFYFAILSAVTPPVALAAFAGAGIAGADPMKTGLTAMRLGLAAYIVPYMFVYGPALLLIGSPAAIALSVTTALIGILALAATTENFLFIKPTILERVMLLVSALVLIKPDLTTDVIGISLLLLVVFSQKVLRNKKTPTTLEV
jgi:TRAP transporter 4TM/12TM fusion protein